jgi:glycosyltransferase involved in cell wall biosynthesis
LGWPKFSVVTISYNQAEYLERAIQSVIRQQDADFEYIIVDPGSTDESRDIIERYRSSFSHMLFDRDNGPADGLNRALSLATGDYFFYLCADDEIEQGMFREAKDYLRQRPVDVLYANGVAIDRKSNILRPIYSAWRMSPDLYARGLGAIVEQSALVRTSTLRSIGGFNVENRTSWDGEAFFDIARAGGTFRRVWRTWGRFRIYADSISGSGRHDEQYRRDKERMRQKLSCNYNSFFQRGLSFTLWLVVRVCDFKRWPTYVYGPFRPALAAKKWK